jgi:hypothetical protein
MDPEFWLFALLGGLALAGRLRRVASPAGRTARSAVQSAVRPAQSAARSLLPLGGGPVATVMGAAGTVIGEAIGEVLDGTAAAADWATGRRPPQPGAPVPAAPRATRPATSIGPATRRATSTGAATPTMTAATTKKATATRATQRGARDTSGAAPEAAALTKPAGRTTKKA